MGIYVPLIARAKWVEWWILTKLGKASLGTLMSASFVLGATDTADWITDGIFPVQAFKCEPFATEAFAYTFSQSKMPFLAPIVSKLTFTGAAYFILLLAALSQHFAS